MEFTDFETVYMMLSQTVIIWLFCKYIYMDPSLVEEPSSLLQSLMCTDGWLWKSDR
jgi:hypothetical protein